MQWDFAVDSSRVVGEAHASTIVETAEGDLLVAWFGGAPEGNPACAIWMARYRHGRWEEASVVADESEMPCWNPVLYRDDEDRLWLFYKAGPDPQRWTGFFRCSTDGGHTWGEPVILPAGLYGPIKNKPVRLHDGRIACGSSTESYRAWSGWVYLCDPGFTRWSVRGPLVVPGVSRGVIQPTLWEVTPGHLRALLRATAEIGFICRADSTDGGHTWSPAKPTSLPNPNSGIDAVKLADGRVVLAYNHTQRGRGEIHLAVSTDDGEHWSAPWPMESDGREYSYPAIIQTADGLVHVTYTWNRLGIRHAAFSPDEITRISEGTLPTP